MSLYECLCVCVGVCVCGAAQPQPTFHFEGLLIAEQD